MRKKKTRIVLLTVVCVILLCSGIYAFTPAGMHDRGFSKCENVFSAQKAELNAALPTLTALAGTTEDAQPVGKGLYAYIHGSSSDSCVVDFPLSNVGDFYQSSYIHGLLWTTDSNSVVEQNPNITLHHLEGNWYSYGLVKPQ